MSACKEKQIYRIGVSQCSSDDWRNKCNEEIYRELIFHPDAEVEIRSAEDSNEKQIADIKYFVENNFDIIVVAPNEADAITPIINKVYEQGIPVVIFDRNINGDSYTAYQGVDNIGIGESAARYGKHLVGEGGKVIEIYGLPGSTPAIERHEGFVRQMSNMGLTLQATAYGNWNYDDAAVACDSLFRKYKDVDLIYAHNDRMAIAAADVAARYGLDVQVIGVDAAPEIGIKAVADGKIDATFLYPTEGYRLIRTALAILKGEPYERKLILPKSSVVDLSNADILLLQNETMKEETDKIRKLKLQVDDYLSRHAVQTTLLYTTLILLILIAGVLFLLLHAFWQRKRYQHELLIQNKLLEEQRDMQKDLNEQLRVATQSKLVFFTNVSHDLRTPLTLIAEPVEQLLAAENLTPKQSSLMHIANKNILILKRLINQILDFRKYENGKLEIVRQEVDFASLVKEWAESFRSLARKRDIKLQLNIDLPEHFTLAIDVEKMERVFFNIMSNAFKHTPDNGRISFSSSADESHLSFCIKDSGSGISADQLDKIFDRFYQVDKIHPQGSGIGLSLVKAFVELHGGTITVESKPDEGAKFIVRLPILHVEQPQKAPEAAIYSAQDVENELGNVESENLDIRPDDPLLLVIDDNEDIRQLIT
ncbi:MAG: substrate-binding domain-containing protein, partial [Muribaculaceae bacterium]|nr:substrate-binding domain-containing protein [Muribaculaceae bacterium]